jgi:hypothetical protein
VQRSFNVFWQNALSVPVGKLVRWALHADTRRSTNTCTHMRAIPTTSGHRFANASSQVPARLLGSSNRIHSFGRTVSVSSPTYPARTRALMDWAAEASPQAS